jgi:hypothetical protein
MQKGSDARSATSSNQDGCWAAGVLIDFEATDSDHLSVGINTGDCNETPQRLSAIGFE